MENLLVWHPMVFNFEVKKITTLVPTLWSRLPVSGLKGQSSVPVHLPLLRTPPPPELLKEVLDMDTYA